MPKNKIIIGNWKMNPDSLEKAKQIFSSLKHISKNFKTKLVVCPPGVFLSALKTKGSNLSLGAQNVFHENPRAGSQAFTGEISVEMLRSLGVEYVILGHSERRKMSETNEMINKKLRVSLEAGLTPIVCVGEEERDVDGLFFEKLKIQIKETFTKLKKEDLQKIIIAYEPIWAIGKSEKENMKGADLHQMTIFIRKIIAENYGKNEAFKPRIIYGGSVTAFNVKDIISEGQVQGILPGRASLDAKEIKEILEIIDEI